MSTTRNRIVNYHGVLDWVCQFGEFQAEVSVWFQFTEGESASHDTPAGDHDITFQGARIEKMNDDGPPDNRMGHDWFAMCFAESRRDELEEMIAAKVLGY